MKTVIITLITLTSLFAQELAYNSYTREDILTHAFINSEALKEIEAEVNKISSMRKEYNGKALPTINGSVGYQHQIHSIYDSDDPSIYSYMDPTEPGYNNDATLASALDGFSTIFNVKNALSMDITLAQPIFAQGKVMTGIKIAKIYEATMHQRYRDAQFSIAENIIGSYNLALIAQKNVAIQEEALQLAEESHDIAVKRNVTGKGSALDTLNSRFMVQEAIYKVREAKKNHRLAMHKLFTTAALSADANSAALIDTLSTSEFTLTYTQAEELMMQNNSTILMLNLAEELQAKMTNLAKTDFLPMLVGGASMAKISQYNNSDDFVWKNDAKLFASLTVPIFSGGQRFQKVKQAQFDEDKIREKKSGAIRMMQLALTASFEEYEVALADLQQTKELTLLSKEGFRISKLSFEVGQITQLDLSRSQNQYNMAQLAYYNALYTLQVAVTKIERLIGEESLLAAAPQMEDSNE